MRYTRPFGCFVFPNLDGKTQCALFHLSGQHGTFLYNQLFLWNPKDEQLSLEAEWCIKAINSHSSYGRRVPFPVHRTHFVFMQNESHPSFFSSNHVCSPTYMPADGQRFR